ncbi:MAG: AraC family transcriptional regulator ligand-binding domain-containing protein [Anaerolineaceae bacterium]|nr:AraC family transcriptional regulator ligand-binding domain-containing protein [Anaerolineaceae bacterium]
MTENNRMRYEFDKGWLALFKDLNIASQDVLRHAQLPLDLFSRKPITITGDEYFRLWRGLAFATRDHPTFPLQMVQAISTETLSPALFAAFCSDDLNTALHRISKYKPLVGPLRMTVAQRENQTQIVFTGASSDDIVPENLVVVELAFWVHVARMATRERIIPKSVHMIFEPPARAAHEAFFNSSILLSSFNGLTFEAADAAKPFITTNHALWSILQPELNKRLQDITQESSFKERVRACLLERLASGHYSMGDAASKLAMSRRTLHRRLKEEDTTFQKVLDELREELARHYLSVSDYSSTEIAFLLGYEETNSFYRAFRAWTGETPEAVRAAG